MKKILFLILASISLTSNAGFLDNRTPLHMFGNDVIYFGVNDPPSDTCNYFQRHFKFNATTESGKNMLSILLSAVMAGKAVNVWYTESAAPGTNQDSGCNASTLAIVTAIGIK